MTTYVVDASVAVKWYLPEVHSQQAATLLNPDNILWAPELIFAELGNVCWKRVQRKELDSQQASMIVQDFLASPLRIEGHAAVLEHAWRIAVEYGRSVYDSLYLALANQIDAPLVTADLRFYNALRYTTVGERLMWVETLEET